MRPPDAITPDEAYLSISEARFQRDVIQLAMRCGWEVTHIRTTQRSARAVVSSGFPDLVLCRPPELLWVELKTTRGKLSPAQRAWRDMLAECGQEWRLWRPADWQEIERTLQ